MSTKIRLARGGRKNAPFYKIVVANSTSPRDGKFIEKVGTYNPLLANDHKERITIKKERIEYWLGTGAKPTERVSLFLNQLGVKGAEKYKAEFDPRKKGHGAKKKAQELAAKAAEAAQAKAEEEAAAKAESEAAPKTKEEAPKSEENTGAAKEAETPKTE
jgi:small subunit ribosomal protein S16